jgi:hypothetical protein
LTVVPTCPIFLFSLLKTKLKGTIEVIKPESQGVLNTLTEHSFQDLFKKWQKRWERYMRA